jgi:hypothetical protein
VRSLAIAQLARLFADLGGGLGGMTPQQDALR